MKFYAAAVLALIVCAGLQNAARAETAEDGKVKLLIKAVDPDGGKLSFTWTQISGPAVKITEPAASKLENAPPALKYVSETYFVPTESGKYVFQVSVKNERGEESKKLITRDVVVKGSAPTAPPPEGVAVLIPDAVPQKPVQKPDAVAFSIRPYETLLAAFPEPWKRKCKP